MVLVVHPTHPRHSTWLIRQRFTLYALVAAASLKNVLPTRFVVWPAHFKMCIYVSWTDPKGIHCSYMQIWLWYNALLCVHAHTAADMLCVRVYKTFCLQFEM